MKLSWKHLFLGIDPIFIRNLRKVIKIPKALLFCLFQPGLKAKIISGFLLLTDEAHPGAKHRIRILPDEHNQWDKEWRLEQKYTA